jgi:CTP synthase
MEGANSTEFDLETPFPVIDLLPEQKEVADLGGTMRLGADPIKLHERTRAREIYDEEAVVYERHRHRYEVNNLLRKRLQSAGLTVSGTSPDERLVETIELADHPFFVASQFHPEFKSRPERPAPLFREFVAAAIRQADAADEAPEGRRARIVGFAGAQRIDVDSEERSQIDGSGVERTKLAGGASEEEIVVRAADSMPVAERS